MQACFTAVVNYGFGIHDRVAHPADLYLDRLMDLVPALTATILLIQASRLRSILALGRLTQCSLAYFLNWTRPAASNAPAAISPRYLPNSPPAAPWSAACSASMIRRSFIACPSAAANLFLPVAIAPRDVLLPRPLRSARRHAKLVLAAHPNLAPVTQTMRLAAPRMKTIVCTHGIEVWEPLTPIRRRSLRRANLVLAPSQSTAEHVTTHQGVRPERIRVLPWALDPEFEALLPAASRALPPPGFPTGRVILTVGRWLATERYKGMDTLITALPRLLPRWPELQLAMVGEGDDRDWLEELAQKSGVRSHVHFLSGLSYSQLATCYSACEIFALPSQPKVSAWCISKPWPAANR